MLGFGVYLAERGKAKRYAELGKEPVPGTDYFEGAILKCQVGGRILLVVSLFFLLHDTVRCAGGLGSLQNCPTGALSVPSQLQQKLCGPPRVLVLSGGLFLGAGA
jgi:hypothetical protein